MQAKDRTWRGMLAGTMVFGGSSREKNRNEQSRMNSVLVPQLHIYEAVHTNISSARILNTICTVLLFWTLAEWWIYWQHSCLLEEMRCLSKTAPAAPQTSPTISSPPIQVLPFIGNMTVEAHNAYFLSTFRMGIVNFWFYWLTNILAHQHIGANKLTICIYISIVPISEC